MFNRNRHHSRCRKGRNQHCCPSQMMPAQYDPQQMMPAQYDPQQMMPAQFDPQQMMPAQFDPPQFSPQEQVVRTNVMRTVVPHIHPAHVTTVNQHVIDHQHYFPVTESVVNRCCENHMVCGMPPHHNWGQQPRY